MQLPWGEGAQARQLLISTGGYGNRERPRMQRIEGRCCSGGTLGWCGGELLWWKRKERKRRPVMQASPWLRRGRRRDGGHRAWSLRRAQARGLGAPLGAGLRRGAALAEKIRQ
ncbi:hypothetical protein PR202_ga04270 [Eleusine coracana subsp. coracana]|uniref:Uncharacterized protein n=1 Tax=Eleusine coracana subsp. coracana TaxID=191504 RepID=A0AAV5BP72_ELECO|nr:hypothetical protein PR202_ga04270 [Eleusine coracana subsp. coracana]